MCRQGRGQCARRVRGLSQVDVDLKHLHALFGCRRLRRAFAFMVEVQFYKNGQRCVPVFFSDNFVTLLPGETVEIRAEDVPDGAEARLRGWNCE